MSVMKFSTPVIDRSAAIGVALFTLVGVGVGLAMKPGAQELIGPEGPQSLMPISGARAQFASNQSAFAGYRYGIPDYVIGTDWLQPEVPEAPAEDVVADDEPAAYRPTQFVTVADREPEPDYAPPPPRYPSVTGDIYAEAAEPPEALEPPEPPEPPEASEAPQAPPA
ncbi:hypothetical protein [Phenylobacterium sp.]|uniref:hypothetical protein n=1 Tax=Phenylobacterium sp. TaxID=1871053 RepID=UPI002732558A|nr:hypothetical protein [Phenylobacterium sp.]MDP3854311.1 hypothetical protein [Phenylobacterium sp.]